MFRYWCFVRLLLDPRLTRFYFWVTITILWAPSQYPKRRLFVRSRKVSKPRDWYFKLSYRFEIWQAHRQHCCRSACQISERSDNSKYKSRGFETLRDLTERCLFGYWDGALCLPTSHTVVASCSRAGKRDTSYFENACGQNVLTFRPGPGDSGSWTSWTSTSQKTPSPCSPVPLHFGTKWRSHVPPVYRRNRRKLIREPCHHLASLTLRALCRIK